MNARGVKVGLATAGLILLALGLVFGFMPHSIESRYTQAGIACGSAFLPDDVAPRIWGEPYLSECKDARQATGALPLTMVVLGGVLVIALGVAQVAGGSTERRTG